MSGEKPFGTVLRGLRREARLTMRELAAASGISVRAISDMELGRSRVPQRRTVVALAAGLRLAAPDREALLTAARAARPVSAVELPQTVVLPRSVGDFTGRDGELERLREAAERTDSGDGTSVWVVSGPPGCGKTTLALKAAEDLAEEFPDGCFIVDLHGVDGPVDTSEAPLRLLKSLGVPNSQLAREDARSQAGLVRALLRDRRCLVVLDNACDEGQVRPLLPAGGPSLVVITSRRPLTGLDDVGRLALSELPRIEAVRLLRRILGEERADAEPVAVARVVELCGCLPLALRVAGNWLSARSGWSVAHLVRRLTDEERRLGALCAGDVRVEAAFELSYRQLTASAARMLRLLSLVPGPDMTPAYGAALTATGVFDAEDVMEELVDAGLLQTTFTGRYQLHDLLRLFARARLSHDEEADERRVAEDRLRNWLLDTAVVAGRWYEPEYGAPPASWHGLVRLDSAAQARTWLENEAPAWLAALRSAANRGEDTRVVETAEAMHWFSDLWVFWGHWPEVFRLSSEAAAALEDPYLQAVHLNYYAWALGTCERRYQEAIERADQALEHARRAQDASQQAWALMNAAWAHKQLGENRETADNSLAAMELFEEDSDSEGWLQAAGSYGTSLRLLGRAEEALAHHEHIIAFLDAPDCPVSGHVADGTRAYTTHALGGDYASLGRWSEAADHYQRALLQFNRMGMTHGASNSLLCLGEALIQLGRTEEARSFLRQAVTLDNAADSRALKSAQKLLDSLPTS